MGLTAFVGMVRKDLRLFFSDRRSVIVAFAVPIFIGSFIGSITGGSGSQNTRPRVRVAIVDEDGSAISKAIVAGAQADERQRRRHRAFERRAGQTVERAEVSKVLTSAEVVVQREVLRHEADLPFKWISIASKGLATD